MSTITTTKPICSASHLLLIFSTILTWLISTVASTDLGSCHRHCTFSTCIKGCVSASDPWSSSCEACRCSFGWKGDDCGELAPEHGIGVFLGVFALLVIGICACGFYFRHKRRQQGQQMPTFQLTQPTAPPPSTSTTYFQSAPEYPPGQVVGASAPGYPPPGQVMPTDPAYPPGEVARPTAPPFNSNAAFDNAPPPSYNECTEQKSDLPSKQETTYHFDGN